MSKPHIDDLCKAFSQFLVNNQRAINKIGWGEVENLNKEFKLNQAVLRARMKGFGLEELIDWEQPDD